LDKPIAAPRNRTIDALRGVGAIIVMTFHYRIKFGWQDPFHEGHFLVDLFFATSGYVLAAAYGSQLKAGMGWRPFMRARFIRLYPVYAFATALSVLIWSLGWPSSGGKPVLFDMLPFAVTVGLNLLMLPSPLLTPALYPMLFPAWTLAYELLVNAVWAKAIKRLTPAIYALVLALSAAGIAAFGSKGGMSWDAVEFGAGACRTFYGFTAGLLIYGMDNAWVPKLPPLAVMALVVAAVLAPVLVPVADPYKEWVRLAQVLLVVPVCLLLMAVAGPTSSLEQKAYAWLGDASYGIYLLHTPLAFITLRAAGGRASTPLGLATMAMVCGLALLLDRAWDRPLRRWMTQLGGTLKDSERSSLA
jgi:peptidoglycan/LPS O-acetylase OafA/YrhL